MGYIVRTETSKYKYFQNALMPIEEIAQEQCVTVTPVGEFFGYTIQIRNDENDEVEHDCAVGDFLLNNMLKCCKQNITVVRHTYRYNEDLKDYCVYVRIIGGRAHYLTFKANSPRSVPSLSSINRRISKERAYSMEGEIRCKELRRYLEDLDLPMIVSLSEDATRIIGRPQYDPRYNQIIGFILPYKHNSTSNSSNLFKNKKRKESFHRSKNGLK